MSYYLYILCYHLKETYYNGCSASPERRGYYNNSDVKGFTLHFLPWFIVCAKDFVTKDEALAIERKVSSWKGKKMIKLLVEEKIKDNL